MKIDFTDPNIDEFQHFEVPRTPFQDHIFSVARLFIDSVILFSVFVCLVKISHDFIYFITWNIRYLCPNPARRCKLESRPSKINCKIQSERIRIIGMRVQVYRIESVFSNLFSLFVSVDATYL